MTGTVNNVIALKQFGFILAPNGQEYFFHKSDVEQEDWDAIVAEFERLGRNQVQVTFEATKTEKGPRAKNVILYDVRPET